jgi:PAS domain-containing protein
MSTDEAQSGAGVPMSRRYWWLGYFVAIAVEFTATELLRLTYGQLPLGRHPTVYILFVGTIAYFYGLGPSLLALILGLFLFATRFVEPVGTIWPLATTSNDWAKVVSYGLGATLVGAAALIIRRTEAQAKRLTEEVRESKDGTMRILESITDAFFTLDRDWRFTYINPEAERLLIKRHNGLIGARIWEKFPELTGSTFETQLTRAVNEGIKVEFEEWQPSGHSCLEVRGYPSREGISVYFRDVTEIVELRQSLEHQLLLLQRALAPPVPLSPEGYAIAATYLPAQPGEQIGGDFYDVFPTQEGRVGILIGDVSGSGIEAASVAAATRSTIHAYAHEMSSASNALSRGNTVLQGLQDFEQRFVTVFLMVLDTSSGAFTYSSGGHPPPVIRRGDGDVQVLEYGDLPIGVFEQQGFTLMYERLDPGDKLVMYTDGILEARTDSGLFEVMGVERVLNEHGEESPPELIDHIFCAARDWSGGQLRDDAAVLVIERTESKPGQ